jgi:hypothetical protein
VRARLSGNATPSGKMAPPRPIFTTPRVI